MAYEQRVGAALRRLVDGGVLNTDQRDAVLAAVAAEEDAARPSGGKLLAEVAAYAGAGLLLGGVVLFVGAAWDDLARVGRVAALAVVAIGLALGGVALAGRAALFRAPTPTARVRLAAVLFASSAAAVTGAVGSGIDDSGSDEAWVLALSAGLVVSVVGYLALPSVVGMLACAAFSAPVVVGVLGELLDVDDFWVGLGLFALGLAWLLLTAMGAFVEAWAGYLLGIVIALLGAHLIDFGRELWSAVLTALVAFLCFALYPTRRSAVLMIGGAGAVALAIADAVTELSGGLGAAGFVLIVGAVLLAAGAIALTRSPRKSG
ncbi:putative membrane protein (DUF2157) [Nocardia amikacinitolerans]|uniref:DUF2157 domain-containing protein n=1 Tax=Nocardia amikacinitolerans TaxID=756689 RepID=UPI000833A643|nr:DUF2157 domain-containing protein [Nocardia amikacinitolerans]MCP2319099.1 putative membrane protein (DUF2157) [Nocardia amikacinitolerans]